MPRSFWTQSLGPGLLFAGAAVGVSHLVQSTRAGGQYGLSLAFVVVLANLVKYPAFAFGPHYAAATGTSLLEGYRRQGVWALVTYGALTLGTMFAVLAAVSIVTAGIAKAMFGLTGNVAQVAGVLIGLCALLLAVGRYRVLDRAMKGIVAALTVMTVAATALVLPRIGWSDAALLPDPDSWDLATADFTASLVGWMPSAVDIAVWHSLWTLAKRRDSRHAPTIAEAALDFRIGYVATAFLALCFLLLGAGVMHGSGQPIEPSASGFATQIIALYTQTLGDWSRNLIGPCALAVMVSTTITVVDGFPRALAVLVRRFGGPEQQDEKAPETSAAYWIALLLLAGGSYAILEVLVVRSSSPKGFILLVDLATALSFVTAPILAWLNHRAVFAKGLPENLRPSDGMRAFSRISIALLAAFAAWWLWLRWSR